MLPCRDSPETEENIRALPHRLLPHHLLSPIYPFIAETPILDCHFYMYAIWMIKSRFSLRKLLLFSYSRGVLLTNFSKKSLLICCVKGNKEGDLKPVKRVFRLQTFRQITAKNDFWYWSPSSPVRMFLKSWLEMKD